MIIDVQKIGISQERRPTYQNTTGPGSCARLEVVWREFETTGFIGKRDMCMEGTRTIISWRRRRMMAAIRDLEKLKTIRDMKKLKINTSLH